MYVPDVSAIISDFQLIGEGLVQSVEVLAPPPTATDVDASSSS